MSLCKTQTQSHFQPDRKTKWQSQRKSFQKYIRQLIFFLVIDLSSSYSSSLHDEVGTENTGLAAILKLTLFTWFHITRLMNNIIFSVFHKLWWHFTTEFHHLRFHKLVWAWAAPIVLSQFHICFITFFGQNSW